MGDALVVAVVGEIDMATAPEVSKAISSGHGDAGRVVVDLSEVTFLDFVGAQRPGPVATGAGAARRGLPHREPASTRPCGTSSRSRA